MFACVGFLGIRDEPAKSDGCFSEDKAAISSGWHHKDNMKNKQEFLFFQSITNEVKGQATN